MKYRPVEGRSIGDVKVGDLINWSRASDKSDCSWKVIHVDGKVAWLKHPDATAHLHGFLATMPGHWRIVELIPEPKIEVRLEHIFFAINTKRLANVTYTDGKPTAIELVKEQS